VFPTHDAPTAVHTAAGSGDLLLQEVTSIPTHPAAMADPAAPDRRTPTQAELQAQFRNHGIQAENCPSAKQAEVGAQKGQKSVFQPLAGRLALPHPPNQEINKYITKKKQ